jgi:hypothetical protein
VNCSTSSQEDHYMLSLTSKTANFIQVVIRRLPKMKSIVLLEYSQKGKFGNSQIIRELKTSQLLSSMS